LRNACCRCTTFQIKSDSSNPDLAIFEEGFETFKFGLFFIKKYELIGTINQQLVFVNTCINYPDEIYDTSILDSKWQAAIVLQIVSWAIGLILIINLFASVCVPYSPHTFVLIGLGFVLICCLFEGLIFLVFESLLCTDNPVLDFLGVQENYETECKLGNGSSMAFISLFGYFITGLACCYLGRQKGGTEDERVPVKVEEAVVDETVVEGEATETGGGEPGALEENVDTKDPDPITINNSFDITEDGFSDMDDSSIELTEDEFSNMEDNSVELSEDDLSNMEDTFVEVSEDEFANMEEKLYHGWR
jgi:hypothetical protein